MINLIVDYEKSVVKADCEFGDEMDDAVKTAEFAAALYVLIDSLTKMTKLSFDEAARELLVRVLAMTEDDFEEGEEEE